ncbi:MAG: hypothetical protein ACREYC_10385 [Gammaproteobacteria bacterium]
MTGLDSRRIALVVARPTDAFVQPDKVATGYFLTGDLVLTVRHVADRPDCIFDVRADVGGSEGHRWCDAQLVWTGVGDVDAMLLRTTRSFGNWKAPAFEAISGREIWESSGYAKIAANGKEGNRKTIPLHGTVDLSLGQGPPELALQTNQNIASKWDDYWKGISGAPIFAQEADGKLIGIITAANRTLSNGLIGLPATRLFDEINFRSIIAPSFLEHIPNRPWCLVLTSEGAASDLVEQVAGVLTGFQDEEARFRQLHKHPVEISVLQAIQSVENWAVTVDALARADYLIADVTSFEPAAMLLLGVRSVLRRGVTISVTARELASHASEAPFNVQETKVLSYNDDDFYDDLHRAMSEGAANLAKDTNYLDLPAYHAVRAPRPEMWAEDDAKNLLVLCPFSPRYSGRYKRLRSIIRAHTRNMTPRRMLDLRSPRLVGQALYEQIRWSSHCIVDWTGWSPNVFFELGVRLACSEHDPLCFIDQLDLGEESADTRIAPRRLKQHAMLRELLEPVQYDRSNPREALKNALDSRWPGPQQIRDAIPSWRTLPPGGTFAVAQASFQWRQDHMLIRPHDEQRERAEQILGRDQQRQPERLVLFADNEYFDAALRAAVREKWIAAWLYLRHLSTSNGADQDEIRTELMVVSPMALQALSSSNDVRHIRLRKEIRDFLKTQRAERDAPESGDDHG